MKRHGRVQRILMMLVAATLASATPSALGQEADKPAGERAKAQGESRRPPDPAELKDKLERRLNELRDQQARVEKALARLNAGEEPAEVMRDFEGLFRGPREGRPGDRAGPDDVDRHRSPKGDGRREDAPGGSAGRERPGRDGARDAMGEVFGGGGPERPLTRADRERVLAFLRENMPGMADRVQGLLDADREGGSRVLARLAPRLREAAEVKRHDQKGFDLRRDEIVAGMGVLDAMRGYRDAAHARENTAAVEAAGKKLREAVAAQFDARLKLQEHDAETLGQRVSRIRDELDRKRRERDTLIDQMAERIRRGAKNAPPRGGPGEPPPP